jgi:hypothetical protein
MDYNIIPDLESIFEGYKPLNIGGISYGELFISDIENPIIVTGNGKNLFKKKPKLFLDVLNEKAEYDRKLMASGLSGDIYKANLDGETFAEKRYRCRENGITQIQEMAKLSCLVSDLPRVRVPKTYFASEKNLLMEYIDAPTWESIVQENPNMQKVLLESFAKSGGMKRMLRNRVQVDNNSKFVKLNENGEYEFIMADPVMQS